MQVNDFNADAIISQLLLLDSTDPTKVILALYTDLLNITCISRLSDFSSCLQDIKLFINSPGGSVTAGMGIYDAMQVHGCAIV